MATWDDVRRIALALPQTSERSSRDLAQWRVRDKLFVWERPLRASDLRALGDQAPAGPILGARAEHLVAKEALVADPSGVFFTTPHFDGYPAVLVALEEVGLDELHEVIVEAWLARAPKRLAREYVETCSHDPRASRVPAMSEDRELDLVLFGATSFVGRLTAEYLDRAAPAGVRVGLAGRSEQRLRDVRSSLSGRAGEWPLIVADTNDAGALAELAARTRALATTVGPYTRYGLPVVEACVTAGTHYADLTGEVRFMREVIDRFNHAATDSGARIVHSCGFDSIPSDLGVLLLHEAAVAEGSGNLEDTTYVVRSLKGGASGGTVASMKGTIDDTRADPALARAMADPYALSPDRAAEPNLGPEQDLRAPQHDADLKMWIGPFIMGAINTRVVRRSNALQDWAYGRRFRYREVMGFGSGPTGAVLATAVAGGVGALVAGLAIGPTRTVLDRVLPSPGEGPSEKQRDKGHYRIDIHTRTAGGARFIAHLAAQGDPGYKATAVMLGESGLCLALDSGRLPQRAGVLTPATAMGDVLVDRLRAAGHTLEVQRAG